MLQVRYANGKCLPEYYFPQENFKTVMSGYAIFTFHQLYAIPMILFICKFYPYLACALKKHALYLLDLYGNVLLVLYRRQNENLSDPLTLGPIPKVVSNANTVLTKNAIIVTAVFLISFTYDLW